MFEKEDSVVNLRMSGDGSWKQHSSRLKSTYRKSCETRENKKDRNSEEY